MINTTDKSVRHGSIWKKVGKAGELLGSVQWNGEIWFERMDQASDAFEKHAKLILQR